MSERADSVGIYHASISTCSSKSKTKHIVQYHIYLDKFVPGSIYVIKYWFYMTSPKIWIFGEVRVSQCPSTGTVMQRTSTNLRQGKPRNANGQNTCWKTQLLPHRHCNATTLWKSYTCIPLIKHLLYNTIRIYIYIERERERETLYVHLITPPDNCALSRAQHFCKVLPCSARCKTRSLATNAMQASGRLLTTFR